MTMVEDAPPQRLFDEIKLTQMMASEAMTKLVMDRVRQGCKYTDGRFTADSVADGLISGKFQLWGLLALPANLEAVSVTTVTNYASGLKAFEILILGGTAFLEMFPYLGQMEARGRQLGCDKAFLYGSSRWAGYRGRSRVMIPGSWKVASVIYETDLRDREPIRL